MLSAALSASAGHGQQMTGSGWLPRLGSRPRIGTEKLQRKSRWEGPTGDCVASSAPAHLMNGGDMAAADFSKS